MNVNVRTYKDGTAVLRCGGRSVAVLPRVSETTELELADAVRWELVTEGLSPDPDMCLRLAREAREAVGVA